MKKTTLIVSIIILILLFSGISYQIGKEAGIIIGKKTAQVEETPILESSKVIQSQWATARGDITDIKDRSLTLTANGDNLTISIKENAELIALVKTEGGLPEPKEIEFGDINLGEEAVVQIVITEGRLEGGQVTILSTSE